MAWVTVAEGKNLDDLEQLVGDMELKKGTRMRVVMNTSAEWLFDSFLAEPIFRTQVPDGMELIDVWGENGQGIVEMEADPAWLVAILAFIRANWLALVIAGFLIWLFVSFIIIMVNVPAVAQIPFALLIGSAIGIVGVLLLTRRKSKGP